MLKTVNVKETNWIHFFDSPLFVARCLFLLGSLPSLGVLPVTSNFVDRKCELYKLADACCTTIQNAPKDDLSNYPVTVAMSAQMWGAGKTTLGLNLLPILHKEDENQEEGSLVRSLEKKFSLEVTHSLLSCSYVYMDLRRLESTREPDIALQRLFIAALVRAGILEVTQICWDETEWASIIRQVVPHKTIFLHVDEIDRIVCNGRSEDAVDLKTEVRRLYRVLQQLECVAQQGSPVYCSGRTSMLWACGQGYYSSIVGLASPVFPVMIALEAFSYEGITEYLTAVVENCDQHLCDLVLRATAGIPRMVTWCADFVREQKITEWTCDTFTRDFRSWIKTVRNRNGELDPYSALPASHKRVFRNLVRASVFGMTFDKMRSVESSLLGFSTPLPLLFGEISRYLNVHMVPIESDRVKVVFPQITVDEIADNCCKPAELPFWTSVCSHPARAAINQGDILECMYEHIFHLRWVTCVFSRQSIVELLPFLAALKYVSWDSSFGLHCIWMPKIVNKESPKNRKYHAKVVQQVVDSHEGIIKHLPKEYWAVLLRYIGGLGKRYVLAKTPKGKSSSADFYVFVVRQEEVVAVVAFQFKNEKAPLTVGNVATECSKAETGIEDTLFVCVARNIDTTIKKSKAATPWGWQWEIGTTVVCVLSPEYLRSFLGDRNWTMLSSPQEPSLLALSSWLSNDDEEYDTSVGPENC